MMGLLMRGGTILFLQTWTQKLHLYGQLVNGRKWLCCKTDKLNCKIYLGISSRVLLMLVFLIAKFCSCRHQGLMMRVLPISSF